MKSKGKILIQALALAGMICLIHLGPVQASDVTVVSHGPLIDIHAENTPLIDVLKAISTETGIIMSAGVPMLETVDCDFMGFEINRAVQRLLAKHNYSHGILYDKGKDGRIVITEVQIFGGDPANTAAVETSGRALLAASPPENPFKHFKMGSFKNMVQDRQKILKSISVIPLENGIEGVLVKSVEAKSFFADLGISDGDIIKNINGSPIRSEKNLIDGLTSPPLPPMIRIEREDNNANIVPIYIKLN